MFVVPDPSFRVRRFNTSVLRKVKGCGFIRLGLGGGGGGSFLPVDETLPSPTPHRCIMTSYANVRESAWGSCPEGGHMNW